VGAVVLLAAVAQPDAQGLRNPGSLVGCQARIEAKGAGSGEARRTVVMGVPVPARSADEATDLFHEGRAVKLALGFWRAFRRWDVVLEPGREGSALGFALAHLLVFVFFFFVVVLRVLVAHASQGSTRAPLIP